ncbi:hypothetical protein JRQ81_002250 [Phrynocephalus forsythii]|uniref:Uncharacterized protein n=1 Tax=Phrynocephalus forsythii TaxID=171643 RepID=A0A9Q0XJS3_9SAUR|nr:hypothetical protein JRQ81_002250 [Phrynocephalus forsythii]
MAAMRIGPELGRFGGIGTGSRWRWPSDGACLAQKQQVATVDPRGSRECPGSGGIADGLSAHLDEGKLEGVCTHGGFQELRIKGTATCGGRHQEYRGTGGFPDSVGSDPMPCQSTADCHLVNKAVAFTICPQIQLSLCRQWFGANTRLGAGPQVVTENWKPGVN